MRERDVDRKSVGSDRLIEHMLADLAHLLDRGERWLRPADQVDYAIRRRVIPVPSFVETPSWGVSGPTPHGEVSVRSHVPLNELQAAIGQYLRVQYDDLAQPIPARLREVLRQLEQRNSGSEGAARAAG
jgi:hypothetical protein